MQKRRPPSFFSNLYVTLQILMNFFKKGEGGKEGGEDAQDGGDGDGVLQKVTHLLRLHGLETSELIHQYHLEQAQAQGTLCTDLGMLTVRAHFIESMLRIELMNARNLKAKDTNGKD